MARSVYPGTSTPWTWQEIWEQANNIYYQAADIRCDTWHDVVTAGNAVRGRLASANNNAEWVGPLNSLADVNWMQST